MSEPILLDSETKMPTWGNAVSIIRLESIDGTQPKLKVNNKYIHVNSIKQNFETNSITFSSSHFKELLESVHTSLQKSINELPAHKSAKIKSPINADGSITVKITKNTLIKPIGNLEIDTSMETLKTSAFDAFLVILIPFIYINTETNTYTMPLNASSMGVVNVNSDLDNIDVANLSLSS